VNQTHYGSNSFTTRLVICLVACSALFQTGPTCWAKMLYSGTESAAVFTPAQPVFNPEPVIPSHLLEEGFQSFCIAKFKIEPNGLSTVKLDTSSGSDEVDELALQTLRRWRFKPATMDGAPVEGTKRIKVEFKVD
jgi:TonB family protein